MWVSPGGNEPCEAPGNTDTTSEVIWFWESLLVIGFPCVLWISTVTTKNSHGVVFRSEHMPSRVKACNAFMSVCVSVCWRDGFKQVS